MKEETNVKIIEVLELHNGAHRNQSWDASDPPDGWAVIPDDMELPASFPFVGVEAEEVTYYHENLVEREVTKYRVRPVLDDEGQPTFDEEGNPQTTTEEYTETEVVCEPEPYTILTVTALTEGVMPAPAPEPEPEQGPTIEERVTTLEDSNAEMAEALDMILAGVTE